MSSGFPRYTQTNPEGGKADEEFRIAAVIHRVNPTWPVWQAKTFGCVQCYSHPYEPFRQEEYYSFLAFFNNTEDTDLDDDYPTLALPTTQDGAEQAWQLERQVRAVRADLNQAGRELALSTQDWHIARPQSLTTNHGELQWVDESELRAGIGTYPPGTVYTLEYPAARWSAVRLQIMPEQDDPATWPETDSVASQVELAWKLPSGELQPLPIQAAFAESFTVPYE